MNATTDSIALFIGRDIPEEHKGTICGRVAGWSSSSDKQVRGVLLAKTPDDVQVQIDMGRSVCLLEGDIVVGYATLYELWPGAWELGTVLINPEYRGRHLARRLYDGLAQVHKQLGGVVYMTTHLKAVVHLGGTIGLQRDVYSTVPNEVHRGLCQAAECWEPQPGTRECVKSKEHGGTCMLCVLRHPPP